MVTWQPRITALDLSLTGSGICHVRDGAVSDLGTIKPKPVNFAKLNPITAQTARHGRMVLIKGQISVYRDAHLFVIEGPSYGSHSGSQSGHHERAGLWWLVTDWLYRQGIPYAVMSPNTRAKYATGKGNASKAEVLTAAIKRFGHLADIGDDNQADALIMACAAADHLGSPLAEVPALNRSALAAVAWPDLPIDDTEAA
jgi:hypothetical protein